MLKILAVEVFCQTFQIDIKLLLYPLAGSVREQVRK